MTSRIAKSVAVASLAGAISFASTAFGSPLYGTSATSYNSTHFTGASDYTTANESTGGGAGQTSATAAAGGTGIPGGNGACGVPELCGPGVTSSASASLTTGLLKTTNHAKAVPETGDSTTGYASTFARAELWDTFTVVTPAGSAGRNFGITFYATVDGRVESIGNSAADYMLTMNYDRLLFDPDESEVPQNYQGVRVDEYGRRYAQPHSSSWQLPTPGIFSEDISDWTTWVSGYLAGGVDPITYTLSFDLILESHAWALNDGEARTDIGHTVQAGIHAAPGLQVTSASGGFGLGDEPAAVPEPATLGILGLGLGLLAWRSRKSTGRAFRAGNA